MPWLIFNNAVEIFDIYAWTDEEIIAEMRKYPKTNEYNFYYSVACVYLEKPIMKPRYENALLWFKRALAQNRTC